MSRGRCALQSDSIAVVNDYEAFVTGGQRSILPSGFELNDGDALALAGLDAAARRWDAGIVPSRLGYSRERDDTAVLSVQDNELHGDLPRYRRR